MDGPIADWFTIGVDALICSVLLVGIIVIMNMSYQANEVITEQQTMVDELREYREYNQYDGKVVYPQDIISAIYRYRGEPAIHVSSSKGAYSWVAGKPIPCEWNTAAIAQLIDQTKMYNSGIVYGTSGQVIGFEFVVR